MVQTRTDMLSTQCQSMADSPALVAELWTPLGSRRANWVTKQSNRLAKWASIMDDEDKMEREVKVG